MKSCSLILTLSLVFLASGCKSEIDEKPKAKVEDAEKKPVEKPDDKTPEVKVESKTYALVTEGSSVVAVFNNGTSEATIECSTEPARLAEGAVLEDKLGAAEAVRVQAGRLRVRLPPRSAALLVPRD